MILQSHFDGQITSQKSLINHQQSEVLFCSIRM